MTDVAVLPESMLEEIRNEPVLWFEFLVDQNLLKSHLSKAKPDPPPAQLLEQLIDQTIKSQGIETPEQKWKSATLNLLALKVAAHLNWNLTAFQRSLPLFMVHKVLKDFVEHVSPANFSIQTASSTICGLPDPILFALTTYNRWSIQTFLESGIPTKQPKGNSQQLPGSTINMAGINEMVIKTVRDTITDCVIFLEFVLNIDRDLDIPDVDYFPDKPTTTESDAPRSTTKIKKEELLCLLCYDLGVLYFQERRHRQAAAMFKKTSQLLEEVKDSKYCIDLDRASLDGYLVVCSKFSSEILVAVTEPENLISRLATAQNDNYKGVVDILKEDNKSRQIPLWQRDFLQLEASVRPDLPPIISVQICLCNAVRFCLEGVQVSASTLDILRNVEETVQESTAEELEKILSHEPEKDWTKLKSFIRCLLADCCLKSFVSPNILKMVFTEDEMAQLSSLSGYAETEALGMETDSENKEHDNVGVQLGQLSLQLILSHDADEIDALLTKLHKIASSGRHANVYSKWQIDKSYAFIIDGFGNRKLQDAIFLLLAKAQHCIELKNFLSAERLLKAAHAVVKNISQKLQRALLNEILYVDLLRAEHNGYKDQEGCKEEVVKRIQTSLGCARSDREIRPRQAVLRQCVLYILNMEQWSVLTNTDPFDPIVQLGIMLVSILNNLQDATSCRKPARELWDALVLVFSTSNQVKRDHTGAMARMNQRDSSLAILSRAELMKLIVRLSNEVLLSVILSALTKLYNIVKDEPTCKLSHEHGALWPTTLSSMGAIDIDAVCSAMGRTLDHALSTNPENPLWLKTKADLELAQSQPAASLRYYLQAAAVTTQFFQKPVSKEVWDDQVYRRMIKCCTTLKCFTHVAIFSQFLDPVDFSAAFKALQEKICYDGGSAMYDCFWEMAILEFLVYHHNKRSEIEKKQIALQVLSQPELNTCNPPNMLKAAAQRRKRMFLLALARQYL